MRASVCDQRIGTGSQVLDDKLASSTILGILSLTHPSDTLRTVTLVTPLIKTPLGLSQASHRTRRHFPGHFWKVLKLRPLKQSTKRDKQPNLVFIDTTEFSFKKQLGHVQKCY